MSETYVEENVINKIKFNISSYIIVVIAAIFSIVLASIPDFNSASFVELNNDVGKSFVYFSFLCYCFFVTFSLTLILTDIIKNMNSITILLYYIGQGLLIVGLLMNFYMEGLYQLIPSITGLLMLIYPMIVLAKNIKKQPSAVIKYPQSMDKQLKEDHDYKLVNISYITLIAVGLANLLVYVFWYSGFSTMLYRVLGVFISSLTIGISTIICLSFNMKLLKKYLMRILVAQLISSILVIAMQQVIMYDPKSSMNGLALGVHFIMPILYVINNIRTDIVVDMKSAIYKKYSSDISIQDDNISIDNEVIIDCDERDIDVFEENEK